MKQRNTSLFWLKNTKLAKQPYPKLKRKFWIVKRWALQNKNMEID